MGFFLLAQFVTIAPERKKKTHRQGGRVGYLEPELEIDSEEREDLRRSIIMNTSIIDYWPRRLPGITLLDSLCRPLCREISAVNKRPQPPRPIYPIDVSPR